MILIVFLFFLFLALYILIYNTGSLKKKAKDRLYLLICGQLLLFCYVFKDNSKFPDVDDYLYLFEKIKGVSFSYLFNNGSPVVGSNRELGYCLYNKLLSLISGNHNILVFSNGLIILCGYLLFLGKYSSNKFLSLELFLFGSFYQSLFIYRQYIAISICLMSIPLILNRKLITFLFCVGIAFTIHKTAFVFILLYILYNIRINLFYLFALAFLVIVLAINKELIVYWGITYIDIPEVYSQVNESNGGASTYLFFFVHFVVLLFVAVYGNIKKMVGIEKLMFNSLIIVLIIDFVGVGMDSTIAGRLTAYFTPSIYILLPNICKRMRGSEPFRIIVMCMILLCFFLFSLAGYNYDFVITFF